MSDKWLAWASVPRDKTAVLALLQSMSVYGVWFEDGVWWDLGGAGECFGEDDKPIAWLPFPEGDSDWFKALCREGRE